MRRRGVLLAALLAGCSGAPVVPGVFTNSPDSGPAPRHLGLLYAQVESGAAGREGAWPGDRKFMASEIAAVVHVRMLEELGKSCSVDWKDLAEEKRAKERMALLGSVLFRDYSLSGQITTRLANELGRASGQDVCLMVLVSRFGPSPRKLELKGISGVVKPVDSPEKPGSWINCGVRLVAFRTPGGQIVWEAHGLASLPAGGEGGTQEAAAMKVVSDVMSAFPWRK